MQLVTELETYCPDLSLKTGGLSYVIERPETCHVHRLIIVEHDEGK